jgi:hypothetical protein
MKYAKIIIIISFVCIFYSCKKNKVESERNEFSFTYNGQKYNYSVTGNISNAGVGKGVDGTPSIGIDMISVFRGNIYYEKTGCAYLKPEFTTLQFNQGCNPLLDPAEVFIYQSGSLNVTFSNCVRKAGVDVITGSNYQYDDCAALGTFDLTLVNKNNEIIKITNGIVKFYHVIIQ